MIRLSSGNDKIYVRLNYGRPFMKEKILSKDHNWETNGKSNLWQEWPAILSPIQSRS